MYPPPLGLRSAENKGDTDPHKPVIPYASYDPISDGEKQGGIQNGGIHGCPLIVIKQ